jgi:uncharacterized protein
LHVTLQALQPIAIQLDQPIPVSAASTASATLYLPRAKRPAPALLCLTVYGTDFNHVWAMANARGGYVVVVVDVPGRGESEGQTPYLDDGPFGREVVAWVARQPWCDGRVAMFGGSYSGINQWATAMQEPPALAAIAPTVAPMPGYDDLGGAGGLARTYEIRWASHVHGRVTRRNLFADQAFWRALWLDHRLSGEPYVALGQKLGAPIPFFEAAASHCSDPAYWMRRAGTDADFARIAVPVLSITGGADDAHRGAIEYHRRFKALADPSVVARSALVIGPWNHAGNRSPAKRPGEPPTADLALDADPLAWSDAMTLAWFDCQLRGGTSPQVIADQVNVYVCGAEEWVHGTSLDALTDSRLVLYPADDRLDLRAPARSTERALRHDQRSETLARFEAAHPGADMFQTLSGGAPDDMAFAEVIEPDGLTFDSAQLPEPLTIIGFPELALELSLVGEDADIAMVLVALLPDGPLLLSADAVRLSGAVDRWRHVPWPEGSRRRLDFARPGFVARRLPAGSRLRLMLFGLSSIAYQANPHMTRPATVTVHMGNDTATRLVFPVATDQARGAQ